MTRQFRYSDTLRLQESRTVYAASSSTPLRPYRRPRTLAMLGPGGTEGRHELSKRAKRPLLQRRSAKIEIHGDQACFVLRIFPSQLHTSISLLVARILCVYRVRNNSYMTFRNLRVFAFSYFNRIRLRHIATRTIVRCASLPSWIATHAFLRRKFMRRPLLLLIAAAFLTSTVAMAQEKQTSRQAVEKRLEDVEKNKVSPAIEEAIHSLNAAGGFMQAAVSPDGKKIIWVQELRDKDGTDSGNSAIFATTIESKVPPRKITAATAARPENDIALSRHSLYIRYVSAVGT